MARRLRVLVPHPLSIAREVPEPGRLPGRPARPRDLGPEPPEPAPLEMFRGHVPSRRRPPPSWGDRQSGHVPRECWFLSRTRKLRLRAPGGAGSPSPGQGHRPPHGSRPGLASVHAPRGFGKRLGEHGGGSQRAWVTPRATVQPSVRLHPQGERTLRRSSWTPPGMALPGGCPLTHECSERQARG